MFLGCKSMDTATDERLNTLLTGAPLHFPGETGEAARIVQPEWIVEAVRLGVAVDIDNAVLTGPLDLEGRYVPAGFSLTNSHCPALVLTEARFLQVARFDGCTFDGEVKLKGVRADQDLSFAGVRFARALDLSDAAIEGSLVLKGATLPESLLGSGVRTGAAFDAAGARLQGRVELAGAHIGGDLILDGAACEREVLLAECAVGQNFSAKKSLFAGDFDARHAQVQGRADFVETTFKQPAHFCGMHVNEAVTASAAAFDSETDFSEAQLGQLALSNINFKAAFTMKDARIARQFTCVASTFAAKANLAGVTVGGDCTLEDAVFHGDASFHGLDVSGALACESATFEQGADFIETRLAKGADFTHATFKGETAFANVLVGGALDCKRASFNAVVNFSAARVEGAASFEWTTFQSGVQCTGMRAGSLTCANAVCDRGADFSAVEISGNADLTSATFKADASFSNAAVKGDLVANEAAFKRAAGFAHAKVGGSARFDKATFDGSATLRGAAVSGDLSCTGATFAAELNAGAVRVGGAADFGGANLRGPMAFGSAEIGGRLNCEGASVSGEAVFAGTRVRGALIMSGATFAKPVNFDGLIASDEWSCAKATFGGALRCHDARVSGPAQFSGASFKGPTAFHRSGFLKPATFDAASFEGPAEFNGAQFGASASFAGATFADRADLEGSSIKGDLLCAAAAFHGEARFTGGNVGGAVDFSDATFKQRAIFDGIVIGGALQCERANFEAEAHFVGSRINGPARFSEAVFEKTVDLRWARFKTLDIGERGAAAAPRAPARAKGANGAMAAPSAQQRKARERGATLDLRGAHYLIIQSEVQGAGEAATFPAERAERPPRATGLSARVQSGLADEAYFARREREGNAIHPARKVWTRAFWGDLLRLLGDRFLRYSAGYGVRPWRMLAWLAAPVVVAFLILAFVPGAAKLAATPQSKYECDQTAPLGDAAWLSVAYYASLDPGGLTAWRAGGCVLTGTQIPAWSFARIERGLGWIFIPLALLTFTGVLRYIGGDRRQD